MIHAYSLTGRIGQHNHQSDGLQAGTLDHGLALTGLTDDDHTQYALLAGRLGGQTLIGGTAASNNLTLQSTSHATKGKLLFGTSAYDEANNRLGIGTIIPSERLHVAGFLRVEASGTYALIAPFSSSVGIFTDKNHFEFNVKLIPDLDNAIDLGQFNNQWRQLYVGLIAPRDGTAVQPPYNFDNGGGSLRNTGLFAGNNFLGLSVSATEIFRLSTAAQAGLLSISSATTKGLSIKAAASQSANLQELQDSSAAVLFQFDASGFPKWVSGKEQTTVGAAGAVSALPANPTKYLQVKGSDGTTLVIPAYAAS